MLQSDPSMSDEEAVAMALRDKAFFTHLVMRYEDKLDRYIRRLGVRTHEDREDVLQEIFIKVYRNLNDFDTKLSFSSWIYRIAHNEAISWYRKKNVRPEGHLVDDGHELLSYVPTGESDVEQLFDESVNEKVVAAALDRLESKYKDPIILRFFEHKEYEEISDILKIPTGTVGTLIHRGKKRLRELVDSERVRV